MKSPKISIIIPVYNVEKYLRQCLDSVVNQTMPEIEVICIDDGSTDGSGAILDEYAARDSRIHVIRQPNQGVGVARNLGIQQSSSPYIAFLDSDDTYEPTLCEKVYRFAEQSGADIVRFRYQKMDGTKLLDRTFISEKEDTCLRRCQIIYSGGPNVWSKLWRRDFVLENQLCFPNWQDGEDMYFAMHGAVVAKKLCLLQDVLYNYRVRENSLTATHTTDYLGKIQSFQTTLQKMLECGCSEQTYYWYLESFFPSFYTSSQYFPRNTWKQCQQIRLNICKEYWDLLEQGKLNVSYEASLWLLSIGSSSPFHRGVYRLKWWKCLLANLFVKRLIPHSGWLQSVLDTINDQRLEIERLKNNEKS
ncbi:MAG: glycosyltransferase family 2 protein [Planctomycetia bacterium]|nr:glycosyltransferase family 2 protein [Planctomycetia bacterium]